MKPYLIAAIMVAAFGAAVVPQADAAGAPTDAILIAFHSPHCGPCKAMRPTLASLEDAGVPIRRVDATTERALANRYGIRQTPTYIVMRAGKEATRLVGAQSADKLMRSLAGPGTSRHRDTAVKIAAPRTRMAPVGRDAWPAASVASTAPTASVASARISEDTDTEAMPSLDVAAAVERAQAATVRLRVHDGHGYGAGTGTIIDTHGEEALVLTCGHLFRETAHEGRIEVDVFVAGQVKTVDGTLVDYDAENRDIAVVAIRPGIAVQPVEVAVVSPVEVGTPAFSFGCDRGKDPSRRDTRITGVDKYNQHLGASNYEIDGAPIDGRSGGGLFDQDGRLIGVCNAADYDDDTGIYAGAGEVRWQLDRIGLTALYENVRATTNDTPPARMASLGAIPAAVAMEAAPRRQAAAPRHQAASPAKEMIVILRDPNGGPDRVVTIPNPSRELVVAVETGRR